MLSVFLYRGVVTVDVPLQELEINQCYQPYNIQNAFKSTARCHYPTQTVSCYQCYQPYNIQNAFKNTARCRYRTQSTLSHGAKMVNSASNNWTDNVDVFIFQFVLDR